MGRVGRPVGPGHHPPTLGGPGRGPGPVIVVLGTNDLRNRWRKPEEEFRKEMLKVGRVYRSLETDEKVRYHRIRFLVVGNSLAQTGQSGARQPDEVFWELNFEPVGRPTTVYRATFSSPQTSDFFGKYVLELSDPMGDAAGFEALPSIAPESPTDRELVIFFSPRLECEKGVYRLTMQDQGINLLEGLANPQTKIDHLEHSLTRTEEPIIEIQMAIQIPEEMGLVSVNELNGIEGHTMTKAELAEAFGPPPLGFRSFGWIGRQVPAKAVVKLAFSI